SGDFRAMVSWDKAATESPGWGRPTKKPSMSWAFLLVWRRGRDSNPQTYDPAPLQAAINQSLTQFTRPEAAPSGARFVLILSSNLPPQVSSLPAVHPPQPIPISRISRAQQLATHAPSRGSRHPRRAKRPPPPSRIDLIQHPHYPPGRLRLFWSEQVAAELAALPQVHQQDLRLGIGVAGAIDRIQPLAGGLDDEPGVVGRIWQPANDTLREFRLVGIEHAEIGRAHV